MAKKKRGKAAKRARAAQAAGGGTGEPEALKKAPHSFVFHRGRVGKPILKLIRDIRRVLEPFTATKLRPQKRNQLKDFIANAGPLGVSHLVVMRRSDQMVTMRLIKVPHGPTLTFRVLEYSLAKDVISSLKKPVSYDQQFLNAPLLVSYAFPDENPWELTKATFKHLFPEIDPYTVDLSKIRRCLVLNFNKENNTLDFRHYTIKVAPTGLSKSAKKLVQSKVPDLSGYKDISEYFLKPEVMSESEYEGEQNEVTLPQEMSTRGCQKDSKVAIRLIELGPRMSLELIKVEQGINNGEVLYHAYKTKTPEEVKAQERKLKKQKKLKLKRKLEQEKNVDRKQKEKDLHKRKCLAGMEGALENGQGTSADVEDEEEKEFEEFGTPDEECSNEEKEIEEPPATKKKKKLKKRTNKTEPLDQIRKKKISKKREKLEKEVLGRMKQAFEGHKKELGKKKKKIVE